MKELNEQETKIYAKIKDRGKYGITDKKLAWYCNLPLSIVQKILQNLKYENYISGGIKVDCRDEKGKRYGALLYYAKDEH